MAKTNDWTVSLRDENGMPSVMTLPLGRGCSIRLEALHGPDRHVATVQAWYQGQAHNKCFMRDVPDGAPLGDGTGWAEKQAEGYLVAAIAKLSEALSGLRGEEEPVTENATDP